MTLASTSNPDTPVREFLGFTLAAMRDADYDYEPILASDGIVTYRGNEVIRLHATVNQVQVTLTHSDVTFWIDLTEDSIANLFDVAVRDDFALLRCFAGGRRARLGISDRVIDAAGWVQFSLPSKQELLAMGSPSFRSETIPIPLHSLTRKNKRALKTHSVGNKLQRIALTPHAIRSVIHEYFVRDEIYLNADNLHELLNPRELNHGRHSYLAEELHDPIELVFELTENNLLGLASGAAKAKFHVLPHELRLVHSIRFTIAPDVIRIDSIDVPLDDLLRQKGEDQVAYAKSGEATLKLTIPAAHADWVVPQLRGELSRPTL
jgi:hypothetical protein